MVLAASHQTLFEVSSLAVFIKQRCSGIICC